MIDQKLIPATQVVPCAPWEISAEALESESVRKAVINVKNRVRTPQAQTGQNQTPLFSDI
jgi:hypothetical protein